MKKLLTTALTTLVAVYGYSQTYLPLTGGSLSGTLYMGNNANYPIYFDGGYSAYIKGGGVGHGTSLDLWTGVGATTPTLRALNGNIQLFGPLTGTSATFGGVLTVQNAAGLRLNAAGNGSWATLNFNGTQVSSNYGVSISTSSQNYLSLNSTDAAGGHVIFKKSGTKEFVIGHSGSVGGNSSSYYDMWGNTGKGLRLFTNANTTAALVLNSDNSAVFDGALSGTAATFSTQLNVGTTQTNANLYVHGNIKSKEVKVEATVTVPDYVFEQSYDLKPLSEVEQYVTENKHLPEIPSAKEIEREGINVGEMQMKLLQKIEELTLHLIEQDKKLKKQEQLIDLLIKNRTENKH